MGLIFIVAAVNSRNSYCRGLKAQQHPKDKVMGCYGLVKWRHKNKVKVITVATKINALMHLGFGHEIAVVG